jgi:hypothetical protein
MRKARGKTSFCGQKEAEKLYPNAGGGASLIGSHRVGDMQMDEVFLLLFVHKKKSC